MKHAQAPGILKSLQESSCRRSKRRQSFFVHSNLDWLASVCVTSEGVGVVEVKQSKADVCGVVSSLLVKWKSDGEEGQRAAETPNERQR